MSDEALPRRRFLVGAGLAGTAVATGLTKPATAEAQSPVAAAASAAVAAAAPPAEQPEPLLFLNETEHAFVVAAVDTLIPADELSPSGSDCGCAVYIDRQLASAWGGGAKMYRNGPFRKAKPEYGYQLPLTPRQFFAAGIAAGHSRAKAYALAYPNQRMKKSSLETEAKKAAKPKKSEESAGPREGSKTARVVAMLQRKNGATLAEITDQMGWQKHTVRGFMAGAMKKAGYEVESFKPEGGERTYRINSK